MEANPLEVLEVPERENFETRPEGKAEVSKAKHQNITQNIECKTQK
jgi:hypothetical protein